MDIVITGSGRGLGRFLLKKLGGTECDPRTGKNINSKTPKIIIHCGYKFPSVSSAAEAISDLELAKKTTISLLHMKNIVKFIFISSVDVYPRNRRIHWREDVKIDSRDVLGPHGFLKLALEEIVLENSQNSLILRPSMMLGNSISANSITKIISGENIKLSLTKDSTFNLISHHSIADFIKTAITLDLSGTFNLSSSNNISLEKIAETAGNSKITFGNNSYKTPSLNNRKVVKYCKTFSKSSENILLSYINSK